MHWGRIAQSAFAVLALWGAISAPTYAINAPIPPSPKYYILDQAKLLTETERNALSTLLIEHDQATGQQLLIGTFKSAGDQDVTARTTEIFSAWDSSRRAGGDGALLAVYADEKDARIAVGYGMGTQLNESESRTVVRDFVVPELKAEQPYRALGLATLEILRAVESPLIESGRAQQLLRLGGLQGSLKPVSHSKYLWVIWIVIGIVVFGSVLNQLLAAEAHFTSTGWYRPKPWAQWRQFLFALHDRRKRHRVSTSFGGADGSW